MKKIELPTVLAFEKSITPTIAPFYGFKWGNIFNENTKELVFATGQKIPALNMYLTPIETFEYTMKTTRSDIGALTEKEKNIGGSNIQRVDKAVLPLNTDSLFFEFSLIFNNSWEKPHSTNSREFYKLVKDFSTNYKEKISLSELSNLYTEQLFSNDLFFRNEHVSSENVIVISKNDLILNKMQVAEEIKSALEGKGGVFLKIQIFLRMTSNQEVYPSQLFLDGKEKEKASGKVLAKLKNGQVFFSDVKIGNAIRKIDSWYEENASKISIQALGIDPTFAYANRKENGNHLYSYLQNLSEINENLKEGDFSKYKKEDLHFIVACLILGGLYNGESKKNK